jgi:hypothetical protein
MLTKRQFLVEAHQLALKTNAAGMAIINPELFIFL